MSYSSVEQTEWGTNPTGHDGGSFDDLSAVAGTGIPPVMARTDRAPGDGEWVVPHFMSFTQLINSVSRTYRWTHDEALLHSHANARAMRRDPILMDALRARQIPVVLLPWHLEGPRNNDQAQADAIDKITDIIHTIPMFRSFLLSLLEAEWFGRYAVQSRLVWDWSMGDRRLVVDDWRPVHGDKLVFKYDGRVGILVHQNYPGSWELTDRGRAHFFTPDELDRLVVHQYEPEDADFYEGQKAGSVHGTGFRERLYWFWYLKSQVLSFLMDYLERVGAGGVTIYYYRDGDKQSYLDVKKAAETQHRNHTILFPRNQQTPNGGPGIQRIEPSNAGAQLLQTLVTQYFDDRMVHYILGQSLTSTAQSTGLGSGVAELHGDIFTQRIKYDALQLEDSLTRQLVRPLQKYNAPKSPPLRFMFDMDSPNALEILEAAQAFYQMGGSISEPQMREVLGLETPQPGESILAKMGSLQPQLAGAVPQGVPMMGGPGMDPTAMTGGAPMAGAGGIPPELLAAAQGGGGLPFNRRGKGLRGRRGRPPVMARRSR